MKRANFGLPILIGFYMVVGLLPKETYEALGMGEYFVATKTLFVVSFLLLFIPFSIVALSRLLLLSIKENSARMQATLSITTALSVVIPLIPDMIIIKLGINKEVYSQVSEFCISAFLFFCLPTMVALSAKFAYDELRGNPESGQPQLNPTSGKANYE